MNKSRGFRQYLKKKKSNSLHYMLQKRCQLFKHGYVSGKLEICRTGNSELWKLQKYFAKPATVDIFFFRHVEL